MGCAHAALLLSCFGRVVSITKVTEHLDVTILAVGSSGGGKSTLLNSMGSGKDAFRVCTGTDICTKRVSSNDYLKDVSGADGTKHQVRLTLVDSPGFPNPKGIVDAYDAVIYATRRALNAVVWVVKPDRTGSASAELLRNRVFLQEFNQLRVPIFLVVNAHDDFEVDAKSLASRISSLREFGEECAQNAGLSIAGRFVSLNKTDLEQTAQAVLRRAMPLEPHKSFLRSWHPEDVAAEVITNGKDTRLKQLEEHVATLQALKPSLFLQAMRGNIDFHPFWTDEDRRGITDDTTYLEKRIGDLRREQADLESVDASEVARLLRSEWSAKAKAVGAAMPTVDKKRVEL
ncbi:unnamed protein product [Prorocentrum cordatum]|uniref:G domain-containing protein n=1 Tax=Prorocentrum cordatum TaxID=2364126 RepID=A0ABN9TWJ0_9DINO|nr:unnamed protein product [Polarella glacialis]